MWKFLCARYLQWAGKCVQCISALLNNLFRMQSTFPINTKGSWKVRIKKWVCLKHLFGLRLSSQSQEEDRQGEFALPNFYGSVLAISERWQKQVKGGECTVFYITLNMNWLGGGHTAWYIDDVLQNRTPETYVISLTIVPSINVIKKRKWAVQ